MPPLRDNAAYVAQKWLTPFRLDGEVGLVAQNRRLKHVSNQKLFRKERALILKLRRQYNLGVRRIQTELRLHHEMDRYIALGELASSIVFADEASRCQSKCDL